MSHTSASVPPSFGAIGLYLLVCESRTARLPTLARSVPSRLVTWEMRPPSQTLLPTCLMALTRPSTIGVLSGFWEGNASTAPLARRTPTAVENSNMRVLLIPISFFSSSGRRRKGRSPPPRYVTDGGNNTPSLRTGTSAGGSTSPGTLPHKQLPRPPSTRTSQNSVNAKFAVISVSALGRTTAPHPPRLGHIGQTVNARGFAYAACCALQPLGERQYKGRGFGLVESGYSANFALKGLATSPLSRVLNVPRFTLGTA